MLCPNPPNNIFPNRIETIDPTITIQYAIVTGTTNANNIPVITALPSFISISLPIIFCIIPSVAIHVPTAIKVVVNACIPNT